MQQRRDGCSSCTLDHEFAMRHDPDHCSEDLAVRERDDVVHKTLHDRKCVIAHALHPEAVDDAVDLIERDDAAGCDALLHRWPIGDRKSTRLNSSHLVISYAVFCLKKK